MIWVINVRAAAAVPVVQAAINHMVTSHQLDPFTAKGLKVF